MMGHVLRFDKELHYTTIDGVIEGRTPPGKSTKFVRNKNIRKYNKI